MIKTAFSTLGCPDWSFHEMIENGTRYGYDGVEIRVVQRETDLLKVPAFRPAERARRRRELAEAGFEVHVLASSVRFDDPDESVRNIQVETGRAYLDLAKELGTGFVRVFGDVIAPGHLDSHFGTSEHAAARRLGAIQQVADGLEQLGEYAESLGLQIVIETHGDFADSRLMQETMRLVQSPAVGVLWDTHHPWRFFGEDLATTWERLRPWVRHTHWKDSESRPVERVADTQTQVAARQAQQLMSGHRHADYVLFRRGEFPARECLRLLRQSRYDGWCSLEWEKMWHPELEGPELALPLFPAQIRELWEAVA